MTEGIEEGSLVDAPDSIIHRDREVEQLSRLLDPDAQSEGAETVFITGPTGSGKTYTAKYTVDQLRRTHPRLEAVYVNCWEDHSRFQVLYQILDEIMTTVDIYRRSTPRDPLLDRLREYDRGPCIVVLDEVDQLDDKGLLYELLNLPRFSLFLIGNSEDDLLNGLDERLASRLRGCARIHFDRFSVERLIDILQEGADELIESSEFEESGLEVIANAADGDARVALTTLRIAARRLEQSSEDKITRDLIARVLPEARQELSEAKIEALTPHHRILLDVIEENGRIAPSELYEKYRTKVENPKSDRTLRTYLRKLERYDLIAAEGSTRNRLYCSMSMSNRDLRAR